MAEITEDSPIYGAPSAESENLGILPRGSLVQLRGETKQDFVSIDVELEEGFVSGWVPSQKIKVETAKMSPKAPQEKKASPFATSRKERMQIPRDESVLLRREQSFFYGVYAGGNFGIITAPNKEYFWGMGGQGGGTAGMFIIPSFATRLEVGYTRYFTGGENQGDPLSIGFLDFALSGEYELDRLQFFGTGLYSMAVNVGDIPSTVTFGPMSDLNNFWFGGGAGYRLSISEISDLVIRARYLFGLPHNLFQYQSIMLYGILEFHG